MASTAYKPAGKAYMSGDKQMKIFISDTVIQHIAYMFIH